MNYLKPSVMCLPDFEPDFGLLEQKLKNHIQITEVLDLKKDKCC